MAGEVASSRERLQAEKSNEAKHRAKVADARSKTAEAKASQTARRSAGDVLSAVLKLKEQGRLPGFHVRSVPLFLLLFSVDDTVQIEGSSRRSRTN